MFGSPEGSLDFEFSAVLRTYNCGEGFANITSDLEKQEDQLFFTLVVDNCSTDSTWTRVKSWVGENPSKRAAVRNPCNLGGIGSLFSNLDLIESEWVIDFHQDDKYGPLHVLTMSQAAQGFQAGSGVVAMATDMGSISNGGEIVGSPPRSAWFLPAQSSRLWFAATTFRMQVFPMPAAAYRVSALRSVEPPWLNTTFGDSELSISLRAAGNLHWIPKQTMWYQENPLSESHIIASRDRLRGLELGFSRVMSGRWFIDDSSKLGHDNYHQFVQYVIESVEMRLGISQAATNLITAFLEESLHMRGYDCRAGLKWLQNCYSSDDLTFGIIENVSSRAGCDTSFLLANNEGIGFGISQVPAGREGSSEKHKSLKRWYTKVAMILPYGALRLLWKLLPKGARKSLLGGLWDFDPRK